MAASSTQVSKKRTGSFMEEYPEALFIAGKWFQRATFRLCVVDIVETFARGGWLTYAEQHGVWFHAPYAEFWATAKEVNGTIVGTIEKQDYIISLDVISKATGCDNEGVAYSSD